MRKELGKPARVVVRMVRGGGGEDEEADRERRRGREREREREGERERKRRKTGSWFGKGIRGSFMAMGRQG